MKNSIYFFVVILLTGLSFSSCKKDNNEIVVEPIMIPSEIEALGSHWGNGSSDVKKVLINTQGGPVNELLDEEMQDILKLVDAKKTEDLLIFNVHQAQTKNPSAFEQAITFEQAKTYDQESVADLAKVIKYFKGLEAEVYVLGISFGAFMTQELINVEGADIADKYLIMVGRLDMPEVIWKSFSEGNAGGFRDGVTPFAETLDGSAAEKNMSRLAAGLGHKRYTTELADKDLTKVTYVYGTMDEQVGSLTQAEIDFLTSKGAKVVKVENADHGQAIDRAINEQFGQTYGL